MQLKMCWQINPCIFFKNVCNCKCILSILLNVDGVDNKFAVPCTIASSYSTCSLYYFGSKHCYQFAQLCMAQKTTVVHMSL